VWSSQSVSLSASSLLLRLRDDVEHALYDSGLSPSDDGLWTDAGHTIGVARSPAGLFVGWLDIGWIASEDPFCELREVNHLAARAQPDQLARELGIALTEAAAGRAEHLRDCTRCGDQFVPGQMYATDCCHSCATRDLGAAF
jgi:hypothetical protein